MNSIKPGDILLFPRSGFISTCLSWLLKLFNYWWDRKHWHTAIVLDVRLTGVIVIEALGEGVCENFYNWNRLQGCAVYHIKHEVDKDYIDRLCLETLGKPYDKDAYLSTTIAILAKHLFKSNFRIVDEQYYCWELNRYWLESINQSPVPDYEYLLITDLAKTAEVL